MEKLKKENKRQQKEIQRLKSLNEKLTSELALTQKKLKKANRVGTHDVTSDDNSDSDIEIIEMVEGREEFSEKRIKTFKKLTMTPEVDIHKLRVDNPDEFVAKVTIHKDKIKVRLPKKKMDKNEIGDKSAVNLDEYESGTDLVNKATTKRRLTKTPKVADKDMVGRRSQRSRVSLSSSLTGRLSPGRDDLEESDCDDDMLNFRNDSPASGNIKKLLDAGKHLENKIKKGADIPDVVLLI